MFYLIWVSFVFQSCATQLLFAVRVNPAKSLKALLILALTARSIMTRWRSVTSREGRTKGGQSLSLLTGGSVGCKAIMLMVSIHLGVERRWMPLIAFKHPRR